MINVPAAVKTFIASNNVAWRADLFTLTPLGGSPLYWTSSDINLVVSGHTFLGNGAVLGRGRIRRSCRLEIDTLEISLGGTFVLPDGRTIARAAAERYFQGAHVQMDHLLMPTPGDLSLGPILSYVEGHVSDVVPDALTTTITVSSDLDLLARQMIPRLNFQPSCAYTVYDAGCGLSRASFTSTGTVSSSPVPTATSFKTNLSQTSGYFDRGVITFTSGALNGQKRSVRLYSSGQVTAVRSFPTAPAVGDAFSIYPNCKNTLSDCTGKFSNQARFRGFDHIPVGGVV